MTREETLAGHRKLWNEIADMIERGEKLPRIDDYKINALKAIGEKRILIGYCYLCDFALTCADCPVRWYGATCGDSEYGDFYIQLKDKNYTKAAFLARTIANLPERVVE